MSAVQRKIFVEGIFADRIVRKAGSINAATHTVEEVVGSLCQKLVQGVNQSFELDEADAVDPKFCKTRIYPPAAQENTRKPIGEVFSNLEDTTMTILIEPADNQKAVIGNYLSTRSTSLRALETTLSQIQGQIQDLKADNQKLHADNKKLNATVLKLNGTVLVQEEDIKNLKATNKKLDADNKKLNANVLVHEEDIKNLKATNKKLKEDHGKENGKLEQQYKQFHKETFKKLNEDRELLEGQNSRLTERVDTLQKRNEEITKQLGLHTRCFEILVPLHLRVLLDLARDAVVSTFSIKNWDEFVRDRPLDQVVDEIYKGLANHKNRPSRNAVEYLCTFNEIRKRRNTVAHTATRKEIARAYNEWQQEQERGFLAELYRFRFDEDIRAVSLD